jgi:hypothetical protein
MYINPTTFLSVPDWPFGRERVTAEFYIEKKKGQERACRRTQNKTRTGWNNPKKTVYGTRCAFVTSEEDGRTYVVIQSTTYAQITVMKSDFLHHHETIFPGDERFPAMMALLDQRAS